MAPGVSPSRTRPISCRAASRWTDANRTRNEPVAAATARAKARSSPLLSHPFGVVFLCPPEALPHEPYDIVVSNILAQPLIVLAPLLAARTAAGGRIALSGILESQAAETAHAYRAWFDIEPAGAEENWALLAGVRR